MDSDIKSLKIMHFAMCVGVVIVTIIFQFLFRPISFADIGNKIDTFSYTIIGLSFFAIMIALIFIKNYSEESIKSTYVLKWALLEGVALVNILLYSINDLHPITALTALTAIALLIMSPPRISESVF